MKSPAPFRTGKDLALRIFRSRLASVQIKGKWDRVTATVLVALQHDVQRSGLTTWMEGVRSGQDPKTGEAIFPDSYGRVIARTKVETIAFGTGYSVRSVGGAVAQLGRYGLARVKRGPQHQAIYLLGVHAGPGEVVRSKSGKRSWVKYEEIYFWESLLGPLEEEQDAIRKGCKRHPERRERLLLEAAYRAVERLIQRAERAEATMQPLHVDPPATMQQKQGHHAKVAWSHHAKVRTDAECGVGLESPVILRSSVDLDLGKLRDQHVSTFGTYSRVTQHKSTNVLFAAVAAGGSLALAHKPLPEPGEAPAQAVYDSSQSSARVPLTSEPECDDLPEDEMGDSVSDRMSAAQAALIEAKVRADLKAKANAEKALKRQRAKEQNPHKEQKLRVKQAGDAIREAFEVAWEEAKFPPVSLPPFKTKQYGQTKNALEEYPLDKLVAAVRYCVRNWTKRSSRVALYPNYDLFFSWRATYVSESAAAGSSAVAAKTKLSPALQAIIDKQAANAAKYQK